MISSPRRSIRAFASSRTAIFAAVLLFAPIAQADVGTAFAYQGQLKDAGVVVNGSTNMSFSLWDAPADGNQIGITLTFNGSGGNPPPISVDEGLFTVQLDFGVAPFTANVERWLQITVGGTTLSPRQRLAPSPFALNTRGISVDAGGRVGLGTTNPVAGLHVATDLAVGLGSRDMRIQEVHTTDPGWGGLIAFDGIGIGGNSGGNRQMAMFTDGFAADPIFTIASSTNSGATWSSRLAVTQAGDVGIGNDSPAARLHVSGGPAWTAQTWTRSVALGNASAIEFGQGTTAPHWGMGATEGAFYLWKTAADDTSAPADYRLIITSSGQVQVHSLEIIGGADLAEPFHVNSVDGAAGIYEIEPGTVVCVDSDCAGELRQSQRAYDRTVAGVISGAGGVTPGMTLRHAGTAADGKYPVALTGRVYCKVDADAGGPICAGDLLTTSDTPGHAMKADPARAPGAVIGKAMSGLQSGKGLVLVLVSLQ